MVCTCSIQKECIHSLVGVQRYMFFFLSLLCSNQILYCYSCCPWVDGFYLINTCLTKTLSLVWKHCYIIFHLHFFFQLYCLLKEQPSCWWIWGPACLSRSKQRCWSGSLSVCETHWACVTAVWRLEYSTNTAENIQGFDELRIHGLIMLYFEEGSADSTDNKYLIKTVVPAE